MSWRYTNSIEYWLSDGTTAMIWCHNPKHGHCGPLNLEALKRRLGGQPTMGPATNAPRGAGGCRYRPR
jgi:hypothetical protein